MKIRDLHVRFGDGDRAVRAVRGISLEVGLGQRLALIGESGCGKSSTLLASVGLLPANARVAGNATVGGVDFVITPERARARARSRTVGIVFQAAMSSINPVRTVEAQFLETLAVHEYGTSKRERRGRVADLLDAVGIPVDRANSYSHQLSGGMRQRVAIALALSCEPSVLLADEPTTGLDVLVQAQILELLDRLVDEFSLSLVIVSHDLGVVAALADAAVVMYAGEIVESAAVDQLFATPAHPYTKALLAATADVSGEASLTGIPGVPPRLDEQISGCPFAPRCPQVFERCVVAPELTPIAGFDRRAACHLVDD